MCGIAGLVSNSKKSSKEILEQMTSAVAHRGPDGEGYFFSHEGQDVVVGLGHRRLSIIDLSTVANQPMHFKGLHIVFNGEIYNYNEIRDQLISKGHEFITHSDTEVILHSWYEWGEAAIQMWKGMFAIALYDENSKELICIRDRAGVKPFYYYNYDGLFLFASELKSMIAHPLFKKDIDKNALASFMQYGYVSQPHCIFENVKKLPAGHLMRYNISANEVILTQYWNVYDYYNKPKVDISFNEALNKTETILTNAFQYRMVADVPVGVFLSGGFDSTCVTALLQKNSSEKIKTFTIGTTDKDLDEAPFAKQIANHLGTDHTEYYCTHEEALSIIEDLPYFYDEPFADSSAIPTILVSRLARKKVTVALSADAGDEIFAGYNRYDYLIKFRKKIGSVPSFVRKATAGVMDMVPANAIPYFRNKYNFPSRYQKVKNVLRDPSPDSILKNLSHVFTSSDIIKLFRQQVSELKTAHSSNELKKEYYDPLSYMMAIDYQSYMVDDILQKVDRATMSVSLEGREPFLDQSIIEWAATLPNDYKYHNGEKKYILKQLVYRSVPKEMMDRKKMGFGIPIEKWMADELRELVKEYLSEENLNKHQLFNNDYVRSLLQSFFAGKTEQYLKLWHLLMFQMWYNKWM